MIPIQFIHNNKSRNVILFIHGFTGGIGTWKTEEGSFPEMLLEDEKINNFYDIAYINYYTKINDIHKLRSAKNLLSKLFSSSTQAVAKNIGVKELSEFLKSIVETYCDSYDNIILIAHSMGGLVSKSFILKSLDDAKVKMFISLAVPHQGSNWATLGKALFKNNPQIIDLKPLSETLNEINTRWIREKSRLPKTIYFYGQFDDVVDKASAIAYEIEEPSIVACNDDHFSITKPDSKESMVFVAVRKRLLEYLAENQLDNGAKIQSFKDEGQYDDEIFVIKLFIADVHKSIISDAKETFFNAEYIRKFLFKQGVDIDEFASLYTKIRHLYVNSFLKLLNGELTNSTHLVSYVYDNIKKEDKEFLKCSLPIIEAYHKTGMLHQLANDVEKEVWWAKNHSNEDIEKFRKARDHE